MQIRAMIVNIIEDLPEHVFSQVSVFPIGMYLIHYYRAILVYSFRITVYIHRSDVNKSPGPDVFQMINQSTDSFQILFRFSVCKPFFSPYSGTNNQVIAIPMDFRDIS